MTAITGQVYSSWRYVSSIIDANNLGVLPIELVSFNAAWMQKGRSAKLEFKTDKESGICCFDIEKSLDGFNFTSIGSLPAKNISGIQSYLFTDNNASNNKQFYRIKIKGISGQVEYSNIQQLQNNGSTEILVFPNPTTDILHLSLNGSYSRMEVQVINAAGQTVIQMISLPVSNQSLRIPLNNLPPGRYWLRLQGGGEKQVLQFVKE
ncbi:MAG: T9SS type A sorting domain-containing protein [Chitinophagaceae bacterium]|nr:T9SS type A sorting domain-containing protein [Chitinophagaceae bacterium]